MAERLVSTSDGFRLHLLVWGAASSRVPVLCLPGLTHSNRAFEGVAPLLAGDRQVFALSLRGRGRSDSDPSGESYALDRYVADVIEVLDALGLDHVALVGTSLGGLTSMWVSWRAPERVAGLVLNDIGPELQEEGLTRIRSYAGKLGPVSSWDEAAAQAREVSAVAFPDYADDDWMAVARQRYVEDEHGGIVLDHDQRVGTGRLAADDPWLVFAAAAERPTMLVRGALTDLVAPATVELMQAMAPAMEVVEVPGRGHAPTLEEPVAIDALRRFLGRL